MAKLAKSSLCRWLEVSSTRLRLSLLMNVFGAMLEMLFSWSITYSKLSGNDRGTSFFILLWLASKVARLNSSCKLQHKHKVSTYYSWIFNIKFTCPVKFSVFFLKFLSCGSVKIYIKNHGKFPQIPKIWCYTLGVESLPPFWVWHFWLRSEIP